MHLHRTQCGAKYQTSCVLLSFFQSGRFFYYVSNDFTHRVGISPGRATAIRTSKNLPLPSAERHWLSLNCSFNYPFLCDTSQALSCYRHVDNDGASPIHWPDQFRSTIRHGLFFFWRFHCGRPDSAELRLPASGAFKKSPPIRRLYCPYW